MGGVIDEAIVRLVRSDECGRTRQPPIHMATPAPKIGNIPRKIVIPNDVGEDVAELYHFGTRVEKHRLQAQGLDALEKPPLCDVEPFAGTRIDPLEGDAELHTGLQHKPPTGRPAIARPPFVNCFWHPSTGPRCIVRQSQDWRNFLRRGLPNRNFWANAFRNNRQGMLARIRNRMLNEFTFQSS